MRERGGEDKGYRLIMFSLKQKGTTRDHPTNRFDNEITIKLSANYLFTLALVKRTNYLIFNILFNNKPRINRYL